MADFARPELIATPEWLASKPRPPRRAGPRPALAAGWHRTRAVRGRSRAGRRPPRLAVVGRGGRGRRRRARASPRPTGWRRRSPRPASATGRRPCCTTTRSRTTRPARGGACTPTASTRHASSTAADPAWVADGGGGARRRARRRRRRRSRRASRPRRHVTTGDVRGLLGAPDVLLVDARGPAEFHGYEGNVRRLGHIPGAVNVPVGAMHHARHAAAARPGRPAVASCSRRTSPAARRLSATTSRASRRRSSPGS